MVPTTAKQTSDSTIEECEKALIALGLSAVEIEQIRATIATMIERYLDVHLA